MFQAMPFERAGEDRDASAGFTLIEALVALAVTAISVAAIGLLMAGNIRGSGRIEQHLGLVETLRAVETGLPDRTSLSTGTLSGEMHDQAWSVDVAPFPGDFVNPHAAQFWTPQTIVIKVQSPSGAALQLETIRLGRRTGEQ
ncbi:MAG: prepilin-type N-terminal cleavage/methylation domain-containing protein [Methylocella sp.]